MANTGKQRSLTMIVNKTVAGVQSEDYPRTYYGRNEFTQNSIVYPAIDTLRMSTMPLADYTARLAAFKAYVESIEAGLDVDESTIAGSEAYRENLTACPIL
jgi:hypothetical protein